MTTPWVVMRSMNDIAVIEETLAALRRQTVPCKILNIDSGSTDGTLKIIARYTDRLISIRPEEYIPGWVLNKGMEATDGEVVVFLNSDTTPQTDNFLEAILAPFSNQKVAASYGRQMPRPDCWPLFRRDTERAFGDGSGSAGWNHFFSMAASAIRRSVWERRSFDAGIKYSEDVEWTWWARKDGWEVCYAKKAETMHSHNYNLSQSYKRHRGEGDADARIFTISRWRASFPFYVVIPSALEILRDLRWCLTKGHFATIFHSLILRPVQRFGRWRGHSAALAKLACADTASETVQVEAGGGA